MPPHSGSGLRLSIILLFATAVACLASGQAHALAPEAGSGPWTAPVRPLVVVSGFAPPGQRWLAGHRGVDLAARQGQAIAAAGAGEVVFAGVVAGRGVVSLQHGALRTTYEPVDADVGVGTRVKAGDRIGSIGMGGHCGGRCLHWGLREGSQYLNPLMLLRDDPPVLKTLGSAKGLASRASARSLPGTDGPELGGSPRASTPVHAPVAEHRIVGARSTGVGQDASGPGAVRAIAAGAGGVAGGVGIGVLAVRLYGRNRIRSIR